MEKEIRSGNRDVNVDLIRVLACLIVISVHVDNLGLPNADKSKILWMVLFGDGVAFFFMIMGFFLFKKSSFIAVLKRAIKSIFIPALILMGVSRILDPFIANQSGLVECILHPDFDWKEFLGCILNWTPGGYNCQHLWYVFSYIQVILLFPLLKPICSGDKKGEKAILYVAGFSLVGLLLNDLQEFCTLPVPFAAYFPVMIPAVYAVTGYYIYQRREYWRANPKIGLGCLGVAVLVEGIRFILQVSLFQKDLARNYFLYWNTGAAYVVTVLVIVFFLRIRIPGKTLQEGICFVGQRTLGIYLVHYMMIPFLDNRGFGGWIAELIGCDRNALGNASFVQEILYIGIRLMVIFVMALLVSSIPAMIRMLKRRYSEVYGRIRKENE